MYMLIENFHANILFRYWWKNFFLICFNVIKYLLTTRAFWQDCSIWSKSSLFSLSFVAICNWFCTWTVIMNTLDTFIWTACQHTNKTLFIMNDHLVKSTKNVTWKKTKRTSISNITWAAALDPSCTPVWFPVTVVGVDVLGGGHPSRGHGGQSRGRLGFSGAHSGRGWPPPPPPPDPVPEFTQWQR